MLFVPKKIPYSTHCLCGTQLTFLCRGNNSVSWERVALVTSLGAGFQSRFSPFDELGGQFWLDILLSFCRFAGIWMKVPLLLRLSDWVLKAIHQPAEPLYLFAAWVNGPVVWSVLCNPVSAVVRLSQSVGLGIFPCASVLLSAVSSMCWHLWGQSWMWYWTSYTEGTAAWLGAFVHVSSVSVRFLDRCFWLVWFFLVHSWDHLELSAVLKWPNLVYFRGMFVIFGGIRRTSRQQSINQMLWTGICGCRRPVISLFSNFKMMGWPPYLSTHTLPTHSLCMTGVPQSYIDAIAKAISLKERLWRETWREWLLFF